MIKYNLHRPGTVVHIGHGFDVEATIHSVQINWNDAISYLVVWWEEGLRNEEWVHESEVEDIEDA